MRGKHITHTNSTLFNEKCHFPFWNAQRAYLLLPLLCDFLRYTHGIPKFYRFIRFYSSRFCFCTTLKLKMLHLRIKLWMTLNAIWLYNQQHYIINYNTCVWLVNNCMKLLHDSRIKSHDFTSTLRYSLWLTDFDFAFLLLLHSNSFLTINLLNSPSLSFRLLAEKHKMLQK